MTRREGKDRAPHAAPGGIRASVRAGATTADARNAPGGVMARLGEAWGAFRHLYGRTRSRGRLFWGETDVRLLVTHLLISSPGRDVYVDPDVTGFLGFGAVDLVVEAPETWTTEEAAPWALLSRPAPVALAFTVRVIDEGKALAEIGADARRLQAIVHRKIAKQAALCVLDRTTGAHRRFYEDVEAAYGVPTLYVLDASLPRRDHGLRA